MSCVNEPFTKHIIYILLFSFVLIFIWKRVSVSFDLLGITIIKTKATKRAWWWKYIATAIWSVRFKCYKELLLMSYANESNTCGDEFAKLMCDKNIFEKPYSVFVFLSMYIDMNIFISCLSECVILHTNVCGFFFHCTYLKFPWSIISLANNQ